MKRGGAIPGAVFSPWSKYAGNKDGQADKPTLKDQADLAKQLEKLKKNGYDPAKTVISYCHVGLGRGSFQYLALQKAGHENVKVYVGSWDEWGNDPSLPLAAQPYATGGDGHARVRSSWAPSPAPPSASCSTRSAPPATRASWACSRCVTPRS